MRSLSLILATLAAPVTAWEFSPSPICTLTHRSGDIGMTVTYDPAITEYTITVTLDGDTWGDDMMFGMAFVGQRPISIQTDRHIISGDGQSLSVKDRGFGNVLNGLEFNDRAYAILGEQAVGVPLDGIGPAMTAFRNCPAANLT